MQESWIRDTSDGCQIRLYIQPAAKKSEIAGLHGDRLKIKIKAPSEDGRANEELLRFLAATLNLRKSDIEIVRGHKSREKDVILRGQAMHVVQAVFLKIDSRIR